MSVDRIISVDAVVSFGFGFVRHFIVIVWVCGVSVREEMYVNRR